jgi:TRAP-type uncharacterized transport system substrate-binding protein
MRNGSENLKGKSIPVGDKGLVGRIILKQILNNLGVRF